MEPSSNRLARHPDRAEQCDKHGPFTSRHICTTIWSKCPICSAEMKAAEDADAEVRAKREQARRTERMLGRAAIPERFVGRSFDNFKADTDGQRRALTIARDFSQRLTSDSLRGEGLIMSGLPGTGKSHLAAAILQAAFPRDVLYATALDVVRMVRETWRKDSEQSERQVLRKLGDLDLLVIDEIGVQYGTEGEQTILFDVLDLRYRDMRPVILLTNQNSEGLKTYLGERTFDRLRETCRWVPFEWESYRPKARKESAA